MPVQVNLYEAFGGIEASWGNSKNNRLANTKERDASIALDNHGFRYYDAAIGRYISNDPIGYEGGFNLYVHCTNDPVNKFDPLGLHDYDPNDPNNWYLEDSHEGDAIREQQMAAQKKYEAAEAARKEAEQQRIQSEIKKSEEEYRQRVAELQDRQNAGSSLEAIADTDRALRYLDYFSDVDGRKYNYHIPAGNFEWIDLAKGSTAQANIESQMAMLQLNIGAMQQTKIASNNVTDIKNKAVESTGGKTAVAKSEGQGAAPQVNADKSAKSAQTADSQTKWGPEHGRGNAKHNNAIEGELNQAQSQGATNLAKNKRQVDIQGNKVNADDGSRVNPDAAYTLSGTRYNTNYASNWKLDNISELNREIFNWKKKQRADPAAVNVLRLQYE